MFVPVATARHDNQRVLIWHRGPNFYTVTHPDKPLYTAFAVRSSELTLDDAAA